VLGNRTQGGRKVPAGPDLGEIPKFVIGYVVTFAIILWICVPASKSITSLGDQAASLTKQVTAEEVQLAAPQDEAAAPA